MCCGNEEGSYLRLIDSCITQLQVQGPSRTCNESKEEEEKNCWYLADFERSSPELKRGKRCARPFGIFHPHLSIVAVDTGTVMVDTKS